MSVGIFSLYADGVSEKNNNRSFTYMDNSVVSHLNMRTTGVISGETQREGSNLTSGFNYQKVARKSSPSNIVRSTTRYEGVNSTVSRPARLISGESYRYLSKFGEWAHQIFGPVGVSVDSSGNVYAASDGSNSVMKFNSSGGFIFSLRSWNGSTDGFGQVNDLSLDSKGNLYVADGYRIVKFNATGGYITIFEETNMSIATGVAVDAKGNVYVADNNESCVYKFNATGSYIGSIVNEGFVSPSRVAFDSKGNVYVLDSNACTVFKFNSTGGFLSQFGSPGSGNGQFIYPSGIAIGSGGSIYVSDGIRNEIQKFSSIGVYSAKWGTPGFEHGQFYGVSCIAATSSGSVYAGDYDNYRVQKFSSTGVYQSSYGEAGSGQFVQPYGITRDSTGNLYVTDYGQNRIMKFSSSGVFSKAWGKYGTGSGQFNGLLGIANDLSGNVYVVDPGNYRIQKFSSSGTYLSSWGTYGVGNGQFKNPRDIAIDPGNNVYVLDADNYNVQKFNLSGNFISKWGSEGSGSSQFKNPNGIAVDNNGYVYVIDNGNNDIQQFNSTGSLVTKWTLNNPNGIAIDRLGNIFVSVSTDYTIKKFNSSGSLITTIGNGDGSGNGEMDGPGCLTIDADGNVYVVDFYNERVQIFEKVPNLTVNSIYPVSGLNTGMCSVVINGSDIRTGVAVSLTNENISIPGAITFSNKTTIACKFPLSGAPTLRYNLTLRSTDGQSSTLQNAFTVINTSPTITSISPSSAFNSTAISAIITGTGFRNGISVNLTNNGTNLIGSITNRTTTKILCTFLLNGTTTGIYNLTVLNIDGTFATKKNLFTINPAGNSPVIDSFTPASGLNTVTSQAFIINGTNFKPKATVEIRNGTALKIVTASSVTESQIKCSLPLTGLPYGLYNLTVTNTNGTSGSRKNVFTVMNPTPTIQNIIPNSGFFGSIVSVKVSGKLFVPGIQASLVNDSSSFNGTVSGFKTSEFTVTFDLRSVLAGTYNLTVTNPGTPSAIKSFTVTLPGDRPTITSWNPHFGLNTGSQSFVVNGTNYRTGATVTIMNGSNTRTVPGILNGNTTIKCTLSLTGLPYGLYNLTVRNLDGSNGTSINAFTVMNPPPSILSIAPASAYNTGSVQVVVSGSRFINGVTVSLVNGSTRIDGMITGLTSGKIISTFDLISAQPGRYNLTITNPGGQSAMNPFTVLLPNSSPTIDNWSCDSGENTIKSLPFILNGTNLRTGAKVTITNGTTNRTVTSSSATGNQIKCTLSLFGLPYGLYNLTVRNTDGTNATRPGVFLVLNPVPSIKKISPVSGFNTSTVPVTITGSNFGVGAAIVLMNSSKVITGTVTSLSDKSITGSFPLAGVSVGIYNLTVSNLGDKNTTKSSAFTVNAPGNTPVILQINPASGFNNANLPVTITGSNFRTPSVYLNQGSLVKLASPTAGKTSTATTLFVSFPLKGVPGGLYNITVRNSDGINVTVNEFFYVTDQAWISKGSQTKTRSPVVQNPMIPVVGTGDGTGPSSISGRIIIGER